MKPLIIFILIVFSIIGCQKKDRGGEEEPAGDMPGQFYYNQSDPRIVAVDIETEAGGKQTITYLGDKDPVTGIPERINGYVVTPSGNDAVQDVVLFDQLHRLSYMSFHTGEVVSFSYNNAADTVQVSLVDRNDSLSVFSVALPRHAPVPHTGNLVVGSNSVLGDDHSVIVKVVKKNGAGDEVPVSNEDRVSVAFAVTGTNTRGAAINYSFQAQANNGYVSFPIPEDLNFTPNSEWLENSIDFLTSDGGGIEALCFDAGVNSSMISVAFLSICATPVPGAQLFCIGEGAHQLLNLACAASPLVSAGLNKLRDLKDFSDTYNVPAQSQVTVSANCVAFGVKSASPRDIRSIIDGKSQNPDYDFKIVYDNVDVTGLWSLIFTWDDQPTGSGQIMFLDRGSFYTIENAGSYPGHWSQRKERLTFIFDNSTQYRGTLMNNNQLSGTMTDGTSGTGGTWSGTR